MSEFVCYNLYLCGDKFTVNKPVVLQCHNGGYINFTQSCTLQR